MTNFYYKRIYLCIEDNNYHKNSLNIYNPIKGFICSKFDKYEDAIEEINFINKNNYYDLKKRHCLVDICAFSPSFLDYYILNYKLNRIYWLGNINIITPTKKKKENY